MRLAEYSVRKKKPSEGDGEGGMTGEPFFCPLSEGAKQALRDFPFGKVIFYTDGASFGRLGDAVRSPRAAAVVQDAADALPLFAMPDGAVCMVAAGGAEIMRCARYFSEVGGLPCYLFPSSASLDGAWEPRGEVPLGERRCVYPLGNGKLFADLALMSRSLAPSYAETLLMRLALFEDGAKRKLNGDKSDRTPASDEAYRLCAYVSGAETLSAEQLVRVCAKLALARREGAPQGEGFSLAASMERSGESDAPWRAFWSLSALYTAFFRAGKPRRYVVPDYFTRMRECGEGALPPHVPTREEYACRAVTLERTRGALASEMHSIVALRRRFVRVYRAFGGEEGAAPAAALRYLPERCPGGLSAIIRDFGLLEKDAF